MSQVAPDSQLRGALRVLFIAAVSTRNSTLNQNQNLPSPRVYALWEAIHEIPDLLVRWRPDSEHELLRYLDEYDGQFGDLQLRQTYLQARDRSN